MTNNSNNGSRNEKQEAYSESDRRPGDEAAKDGFARVSIILDRGPLSEDEIKEFIRGLARAVGASEDAFKFLGQSELPKKDADPSASQNGGNPAGGKGPAP